MRLRVGAMQPKRSEERNELNANSSVLRAVQQFDQYDDSFTWIPVRQQHTRVTSSLSLDCTDMKLWPAQKDVRCFEQNRPRFNYPPHRTSTYAKRRRDNETSRTSKTKTLHATVLHVM
jgi:hypothetical protein